MSGRGGRGGWTAVEAGEFDWLLRGGCKRWRRWECCSRTAVGPVGEVGSVAAADGTAAEQEEWEEEDPR